MTAREQHAALVQKAVDDLGEHFDTVQVFCSLHLGEEGTQHVAMGQGNWFARYGQTALWVARGDEDARVDIRHQQEGE